MCVGNGAKCVCIPDSPDGKNRFISVGEESILTYSVLIRRCEKGFVAFQPEFDMEIPAASIEEALSDMKDLIEDQIIQDYKIDSETNTIALPYAHSLGDIVYPGNIPDGTMSFDFYGSIIPEIDPNLIS